MLKNQFAGNPWPAGLFLFFVVFVVYIVGFVIFASRQHMELVRADYYDQEIRFQQQIDRERRTAPIMAHAAIDYDRARQSITVSLPSVKTNDLAGEISLYRPSDSELDRDVALALDAAGRQAIDSRALRAGLWRVRVAWKAGGQDYFFEKPIIIRS
ncbi:MAG TPA: FixH family protein [Verrucomicrobiae bacterium]|jgi:hypothetical protein|nr:FixH family protein [Verrucomicrobiae bacterium]